jgi:hypothetical protein
MSHGARQKRGIGTDVIGAIAPVAPCSFHTDDFNEAFVHLQQAAKFGAQHVGILTARPYFEMFRRKIGNRS